MRSIVIPVYNGLIHLKRLWQTLSEQLDPRDEVVFVDDGSSDGSVKFVKSCRRSGVRVIEHESPRGFAASVNAGIEASRGEVIILLNNDLILEAGLIDRLSARVRTDDSIGVISATLYFPQDDSIQHAGVAFTATNHSHVFRYLPRGHPLVSREREMQGLAFAACALRREVVDAAGRLDEGFVNGYEDFDYCFRIRSMGLRLVVDPSATAYHWERQSGPIRSVRRKDNVARLWARWGSEIRSDLARYVTESFAFVAERAHPFCARATVLNLATTSMSEDVIDAIVNVVESVCITEVWDHWRNGVGADRLWLPLIAPPHAARHPEPVIYVVDHFPQLRENAYWAQLRATLGMADVVADTNGNAVLLSDIVSANHGWSAQQL